MAHWYKGFYCKGDPAKIKNIVVRQVHESDLTRFVPSVKPEKKLFRNIKKVNNVDFYLFIAIEGVNIGQVPPEVQSGLVKFLEQLYFSSTGRSVKAIQWSVPGGFDYDEIKSMAEADLDVYNFTQPIPYHPRHREPINNDDPFDLIASQFINEADADVEARSVRYEQLLYLLSALGSGTWESFKKTCNALALDEPRHILRRLRLLGHIEFSPDGSRWSTAPTALVTVSPQLDSPLFLLCGQRSADLLRQLRRYGAVESNNQPRGDAPPCVYLRLSNSQTLSTVIEQIGRQFGIADAGNASSQLAEIVPDLSTWQQRLNSLPGILPDNYDIKRFNGSDNDDPFVEHTFQGEKGMYQLWSEEFPDRPRYTLFYDPDREEGERWLQGDWYGLRFLALEHTGKERQAHYDIATESLAIPLNQRWPEIYERALVLASGQLPTRQSSWLFYKSVEPEVARKLTTKLHVNYEEESACA